MEDTAIKRIFSLILILSIVGCKTTHLPEVSTKLEPVFKEHEYIYKKQHVWKDVQWEYKYSRKVIDSIFTEYNLQDSEDFFIITSVDDLANYSLEIKSIDKEKHLKFYENDNTIINTQVNLSYNTFFKELVEGDFIEFVDSKTQEELSDCSRKSGMVNSEMILFTHYDRGMISVKRFETCNYAEYYNWEIPKEDI